MSLIFFWYSSSMPNTPKRSCSACGGPVSTRGRASRSGRYYCAKNPDCRAAKARDWYATNVAQERKQAPDSCACCGTPLKPRLARRGDSPLGRWCKSLRCQRDRTLREGKDGEQVSLDNQALIHKFLVAVETPANIKDCPACGLEQAVVGFIHPQLGSGGTEICDELGSEGVKRTIAEMKWPQAFAVD